MITSRNLSKAAPSPTHAREPGRGSRLPSWRVGVEGSQRDASAAPLISRTCDDVAKEVLSANPASASALTHPRRSCPRLWAYAKVQA